jgi:ATP-dependent Clp endopeptidase proteolytic subunit ClpP
MLDVTTPEEEAAMNKTQRQWYEIKAESGSVADIWIYEEIGGNIFGEGLTAKQFVEDLAALQVDHIALHINSPGGSVFDGQAIYNAIQRHPASVTSHVEGLAASIASVVALAGDTVEMAANALFMIHDPYGMAMGTSADMRQMAEVLDKVKHTIAGVYERKSGMDSGAILEAMEAETWYTAAEAQNAGFVDEVAAPVKAAALSRFDFKSLGYRHVPHALAHRDDTAGQALEAPSATALEARRSRDQVHSPGYVQSIIPGRG